MDHMVEVGLTGLTHILKGGVRIEKNRNLCYVNTIDWKTIVSERYRSDHIHIEVSTYFLKIQCHSQPRSTFFIQKFIKKYLCQNFPPFLHNYYFLVQIFYSFEQDTVVYH